MLSKKWGFLIAIGGLFLGCNLDASEGCCGCGEVAANGQMQQGAKVLPQNPSYGYAGADQAQAAGRIQWMTNFQQAADKAQKENKYMLLFFTGSDWCGWCKKIDAEVFSDPEFARAAGNRFVFVELDYPMNKMQSPEVSRQNADLKQKFGISGFPTVIILDPNQNFVAETGYRSGGGQQYAQYLMQLLQGPAAGQR